MCMGCLHAYDFSLVSALSVFMVNFSDLLPQEYS